MSSEVGVTVVYDEAFRSVSVLNQKISPRADVRNWLFNLPLETEFDKYTSLDMNQFNDELPDITGFIWLLKHNINNWQRPKLIQEYQSQKAAIKEFTEQRNVFTGFPQISAYFHH